MTDAFELSDKLEKASKEIHEQALKDSLSGITFSVETLQEFAFSFRFPSWSSKVTADIELKPLTDAARELEATLHAIQKKAKGISLLPFLDLPPAMEKFYFGIDGHFHWMGRLDELATMLSFVGPIKMLDEKERDTVISIVSKEQQKRQKMADEAKAVVEHMSPYLKIRWEGGRP